jgi:hypothetical protein
MTDKGKAQEILQECLAALETGLMPEECLSAWPQHRAELEPLLRQAMLLRVAHAARPREEFRKVAVEKLLFQAGSEARQAFSRQPAPDFVARTRNRFLHAAGASTQEALRDVPPPRLAFWANARRRFLEAATAPARRPEPARPAAMALRTSLSAAVVVLAVALAGLAYITTQASRPASVGAELAEIDHRLSLIEQETAIVPTEIILDLVGRTTSLALKLDPNDQTQAPVADKLQEIIERQNVVVEKNLAAAAAPSPEMQQAKQQLEIAEDRVRVLAARTEPTPAQSLAATPRPAGQAVPTLVPATPTRTPPTPIPPPSPTFAPLTGDQIRIVILEDDDTYGLSWVEVTTKDLRFVYPRNWTVSGVTPNANGLATMAGANFILHGPSDLTVVVGLRDGSIQAIIGGSRVILRDDDEVIDLLELVEIAGPLDVVAELRYMIESLTVFAPPTPTATPVPPATATPSPAAPTPTRTSTPTP